MMNVLGSLAGGALNNEPAATRYVEQLGTRAALAAIKAATREIVTVISQDSEEPMDCETEDLFLRALVQLGLMECGRKLAAGGFSLPTVLSEQESSSETGAFAW